MNRYLLLIICLFLLHTSCKNKVKSEVEVYSNDFEGNNLSGIVNGVISPFNNSAVLGPYNNSNFILTVNNLPTHSLITISFDLFIHDSWDGNKTAPDGPDIWKMLVDGNSYVNATFSNAACPVGAFCAPQSYPFDYPNNYNNPKTGAFRTNLPGLCSLPGPNGTSMYKITKTFTHTSPTLALQCADNLVQTNSPTAKCDESWSVDNIIIKTIAL